MHGRFHNTLCYAIKEQYLSRFAMKKRRKRQTSGSSQPSSSGSRESLNTPFAELSDMLEQIRAETQPESNGEESRVERERDTARINQPLSKCGSKGGDDLFREAMAGVEPLEGNRVQPRTPGPLSSPSKRPLLEGELEAYAQLVDLVSGAGLFDIQHTDEYIEGAVVGADSALLPKLRRGDFSIQAHLDLHGMTAAEARQALERFIFASVIQGRRCVLIIHGRGLNSRDYIPILKQRMSSWLKRGRLKHLVLAFATAQPCDGGAGALYVLLRNRLPDRI
jgi:DNA-nicking Smr family endonuclease